MKVEAQSAVQSHESAQSHEPRTKAKAHGLVRRLQEDTFNGASAEKHRARFADRLTEPSVADASVPNDSSQIEATGGTQIEVTDGSQIEATDGTTTDASAISPLTLDPVEFDAGRMDVVDFSGGARTKRYGDQNALYLRGKNGQNVDWTT